MRSRSLLLFGLFLSACGSETVNITLLTPIPIANPTRNLAEALLIQGGTPNALVASINGPSCKQRDLRAGFKAPGWNTRWLPIDLDTEILTYSDYYLSNQATDDSGRPSQLGTPPSPKSASTFLNQQSALTRPIVIPVPKGVPGEIIVQGVMVEPTDTWEGNALNSNGSNCARIGPEAMPTPIKSFAIYGNRPFQATDEGSVSLNINVLQTMKPTAYGILPTFYTKPTLGPPINDTNSDIKCRNPNQARSCANRDLFEHAIKKGVTSKVWIRQPPPPDPDSISIRIFNGNGATSPTFSYFYTPKSSPFLLTYDSGGTYQVLVEFFKKQITFFVMGQRTTQTLKECGPVPTFWGGIVPSANDQDPPAEVTDCSSINYAIRDFGQGFN